MTVKTVPLASLVEDFSLYPRHRLDEVHISDLVRALLAGVDLPRIVVDAKSLRIVDGFHRRRAILSHVGTEATVKVEMRTYADDAAMFLDAVALNASHGRKLDRHDQARIVLRLRELHVEDAIIATTLHVSAPQVQHLSLRVVYDEGGRALAAKRGFEYLRGETLTAGQVTAMGSVRSGEVGRLCVELTSLLSAGMVDIANARIVEQLHALAATIARVVPGKVAQSA